MNDVVVAALIVGSCGVIGPVSVIWLRHRLSSRPQTPNSSGPFGNAILPWLNISEDARKKLGQSTVISPGNTGPVLMQLVQKAKHGDSIRAICGHKGSYSEEYYKANFENCKEVQRVFSYEAILSEITSKKDDADDCYALKGLKAHLDMKNSDQCSVETFLIPAGRYIKDFKLAKFDPPLSFGLSILLKPGGAPKKAIVHWETGAEPLGQLIGIEGVIIDCKQSQVLKRLEDLHKRIAGDNDVLSSERNWNQINTAYNELDEKWNQEQPKSQESVK